MDLVNYRNLDIIKDHRKGREGKNVRVLTDLLKLTDRYKNPRDLFAQKSVFDLLIAYEKVHNPDFNYDNLMCSQGTVKIDSDLTLINDNNKKWNDFKKQISVKYLVQTLKVKSVYSKGKKRGSKTYIDVDLFSLILTHLNPMQAVKEQAMVKDAIKSIDFRWDDVKIQNKNNASSYKEYCERNNIKPDYQKFNVSFSYLVMGNPFCKWEDCNLEQTHLRYDILKMSQAYMMADMDMEEMFDLLKEYTEKIKNKQLIN